MEEFERRPKQRSWQADSKMNLPFKFTGSASEYFRIWYVNVLFNVLTLGIYSAWAKVRNKQYFYRHTWLDGTSFEYDGDPLGILKGRIIVGAFFVGIYLSSTYSLYLNYGLLILLFLASPWLAIKSWAFNARNSSYRNLRFSFRGSLGEAYTVIVGLTILNIFTLGLLVPYTQWRTASFKIKHHGYGTRKFSLAVTAGPFYAMYLVMGAIGFASYVATFGIFNLLTEAINDSPTSETWPVEILTLAFVASVYLPMILSFTYLRANSANLVYGNTRTGKLKLRSNQRTLPLLWIYLSNFLAILISVGLLVPWAKVRLARYRIQYLSLWAGESLEVMADEEQEDPSALGEAGVDFGGFDFGL